MDIDLYPGVAMWTCWLHNAKLYGPLYGETRCSHVGCPVRLSRSEYNEIRFGRLTRQQPWFITEGGYILENHGVPVTTIVPFDCQARAQPVPWYHMYLSLDSTLSTFWGVPLWSADAFIGQDTTSTSIIAIRSTRLECGVHKPFDEGDLWQPVKDDIILGTERVFAYVATLSNEPKPWERAALEAEYLLATARKNRT